MIHQEAEILEIFIRDKLNWISSTTSSNLLTSEEVREKQWPDNIALWPLSIYDKDQHQDW